MVQGLSTVLMFSLAIVPDPVLAGVLYIARAALMNMASPILDAYLMGLVKAEERGFASALNSIIWRMPNSASTVVGGSLLYHGEYQLPFLIAGTLYAIGVSLFFGVFRAVKAKERVPVGDASGEGTHVD
jgi:predicted MFS family arabinose efflux permease